MEYKKRIADNLLQDKLDAIGAVLVEGPKVCGKWSPHHSWWCSPPLATSHTSAQTECM